MGSFVEKSSPQDDGVGATRRVEMDGVLRRKLLRMTT